MTELRMLQMASTQIACRVVRRGDVQSGVSGKTYCRVRVAWDRGFGDKKTSSFANVVAFGAAAERLAEINKGEPVVIIGEWYVNQRERGESILTEVEIVADSVSPLSWPSKKQEVAPPPDKECNNSDCFDLPF